MNRFSKELLEAIAKRYNEGKPELIKDDLRRISRKFGIAFADADMERKRIENQLADEWTRDRSNDKIPKIVNTGKNTPLNPLSRGDLEETLRSTKGTLRGDLEETLRSPKGTLRGDLEETLRSPKGTSRGEFENADGAFARMRNSVNRDVKRAVDRAIKNKMPTTEAVKIIKRVLGKLRADAATIGRTAKMGKIRSDFIRKALADGITRLRYAGPSGASSTMDSPRTFCQRNLGKVFTIEEILELNNGQGLPVLIYMGGYNCRHWWEAVSDNYELRITNDEKKETADEEIEDGVKVSSEWRAAFKKANNKDRGKLQKELNDCKIIKKQKPDWDIQMVVKLAPNGGPVDALINNRNAEFKNPSSKSKHVLNNNLREASEQSNDIYIFINSDIAEYDEQVKKAKGWLIRHPEKRLYIIDELTNEMYEVKIEKSR